MKLVKSSTSTTNLKTMLTTKNMRSENAKACKKLWNTVLFLINFVLKRMNNVAKFPIIPTKMMIFPTRQYAQMSRILSPDIVIRTEDP